MKAVQRSFLILSYRAHSKNELKRKLTGKFSDEAIQKALDYLEEKKYLNDQDFSNFYFEKRRKGSRLIAKELLAKGVSKETVDKAQSLRSADDEIKLAQEILEKKLRTMVNLEERAKKQKSIEFLLRQGFSYEIIKKIV